MIQFILLHTNLLNFFLSKGCSSSFSSCVSPPSSSSSSSPFFLLFFLLPFTCDVYWGCICVHDLPCASAPQGWNHSISLRVTVRKANCGTQRASGGSMPWRLVCRTKANYQKFSLEVCKNRYQQTEIMQPPTPPMGYKHTLCLWQ